MISREEMLAFARGFQLEPNAVEKDYALGWLLAGIGNYPVLRLRSKAVVLKKLLRSNGLSFHASNGVDFVGSPGEPKDR